MCSDESDWTCLQPGFPIRKSTDHSLVIDSPWLIADSYVLLRFLVPRHPPCALKNLSHKDTDARVHCVVLNIRTTPTHPEAPTHPHRRGVNGLPRAQDPTNTTTHHQRAIMSARKPASRPNPQDPTTCPGATTTPPTFPPHTQTREVYSPAGTAMTPIIDVPPMSTQCPTLGDKPGVPTTNPHQLRQSQRKPHGGSAP